LDEGYSVLLKDLYLLIDRGLGIWL
jgi:hypothetical protein